MMKITQEFLDAVLKLLQEKGPHSWYEIVDLMKGAFPDVDTGAVIVVCVKLRKRGLVSRCHTDDYNDAEGRRCRYVNIVYTTDWDVKTALPHWYKTRGYNARMGMELLEDIVKGRV